MKQAGTRAQVYTYHGGDRERNVGFLAQQDVVLTTYNVLSTEVEAKNGIMKVSSWLTSLVSECVHLDKVECTCLPVPECCNLSHEWLENGSGAEH